MTTRGRGSPDLQASLPPSPVEEDIGRAASSAWREARGEGDESATARSSSGSTLAESGPTSPRGQRNKKGKGKGKDRARSEDDDYEFAGGESLDSDEGGVLEGYPPTKEEEAESRRVEENLRRWEMAERQRRKAARESQLSTATAGTSVVSVTRTMSLLLSGKRNKRPSMDGAGSHHVLQQSNDDGVPLEDLDNRLAPSPAPEHQNPFTTPAASTVSLHASYETTSDPGNTPDTPTLDIPQSPAPRRPPKHSPSKSHPPPAPLDLPEPRAPPPRTLTPYANRPPEPTSPPTVTQTPREEAPVRETRWWTEWLCGCVEKGDHQAGRTNPFE